MSSTTHLKKSLSVLHLWGLGVGYVISGMYFGWNLGLKEGGTLGMAIATLGVVLMYACFTLSYAELACAIPKAGGVFDYTNRALGKNYGFVAGLAQIIEFVFAPPAIAVGIGSYLNGLFPEFSVNTIAIVAYFIFTFLNILGAKLAATFELFITAIAVLGLVLFCGITLPRIELSHLTTNVLPNGFTGIFAAIPFAVWFFLGIEGLANVAEESMNPERDIKLGFGFSLSTLVVLCVFTFICSVGLNGWEAVVFKANGTVSDTPLPLALSALVSENSLIFKVIVSIGTCGLVASFHGLILAAGRATYEFGYIGNAPKLLGKIQPKFQTPANALLFNMVVGILILISNSTATIIVLSVFGALLVYLFSVLSMMKLRTTEPNLNRPFQVPFYPIIPITSLFLTVVSLLAMVYYNFYLAIIFVSIILVCILMQYLINSMTPFSTTDFND